MSGLQQEIIRHAQKQEKTQSKEKSKYQARLIYDTDVGITIQGILNNYY